VYVVWDQGYIPYDLFPRPHVMTRNEVIIPHAC